MARFKHLVVDANALISGASLAGLADQYWTVEAVKGEVRDAAARAVLETLPYDLQTRIPSDEALAAVKAFAVKTGDASKLSGVDLQLIALAYQLERQENGVRYIRAQPPQLVTTTGLRHVPALPPACRFFNTPGGCRAGEECRFRHLTPEQAAAEAAAAPATTDATSEASSSAVATSAAAGADAGAGAAVSSSAVTSSVTVASVALPSVDNSVVTAPMPAAAPSTTTPAIAAPAPSPAPKAWSTRGWGKPPAPTTGAGAAAAASDAAGADDEAFPAMPPAGTPVTIANVEALMASGKKMGAHSAADGDAEEYNGEEEEEEMTEEEVAAAVAAAAAAGGADADDAAWSGAAEDDEDGEWIVPTSAKSSLVADTIPFGHERVALTATEAKLPEDRVLVACITADYAMQNVLLQMNLNLASVGGKIITSVKHWVQKCDACFFITPDMTKLFCPRCGNATLARLGVTLAADGTPRYHYKANRQVSTRGTVFGLPKPKGGRNLDILLREDQLLMGGWAQQAKAKVTKTSMFADRTTDADNPTLRMSRTERAPDVVVGFGRRNPNEARRRRK